MATVTRYFGVTSAGTGDGTSFANRAALFSSGNWSSIITGFNFLSDDLRCLIATGSYTCSQTLNAALFSVNSPNAVTRGQLYLVGCDSNGNELSPPDPNWNCCQPDFDTSSFPSISMGSANFGGTLYVNGKCVRLTSSASSHTLTNIVGNWNWCHVSTSGTAAAAGAMAASAGSAITNSVLRATGSGFAGVLQTGNSSNVTLANLRIEGNSGATTGVRHGITGNNTVYGPVKGGICIVNCPGGGLICSNATASHITFGNSLTIVNCGVGFGAPSGTAGSSYVSLADSFIVNCTTGVHQADGRYFVSNCRLANTNNFNTTALGPVDTYTAAHSDSDFVDAANGDYRIARSSQYWGRKLGAGDQPYHSPNLRTGFQS